MQIRDMSPPFFKSNKTLPDRPHRRCVVFIGKTKVTAVTIPDKVVRDYVYPPDMVMDGDVLKREDFRAAVTKWIIDSQIRPADALCIVQESATFEKTFQPSSTHTRILDQSTINTFIEAVPLQRVVVVRLPQKDYSTKVLVANRDLLSTIYHAFEKSAFSMLGIFPNLNLVLNESENPKGQSTDLIEETKKHFEFYALKSIHQPAFELDGKRPTHSLPQINVAEAARQPVQPWVAVVIVLLLVLGAAGIWFFQYQSARQEQVAIARKRAQLIAAHQAAEQASEQEQQNMVPVSAINTPLVEQTPPIGESATPAQSKLIRVQIIYTQQTQKLFDDVYNKLRQVGAYQISNQMSTLPIAENKMFISPNFDVETTTRIIDLVQGVGVSAATQEAQVDEYDVVLQLGVYAPSAPSQTISPTRTP